MVDASPNPQVGAEWLRDDKGKRVKLLDGWSPADWGYWLELLTTLITSCVTPTTSTDKLPATLQHISGD